MKRKEIVMTSLLLFIDQCSKYVLEILLKEKEITIIPNFFTLYLTYNQGAAWSILNGASILLILISIFALFFFFFLRKQVKENRWMPFLFSMIYAGILGNLWDRILIGSVRDFLSFNFFSYHFPIFNLADTYIVIGIILLVVLEMRDNYEQNHGRNQ